MNSDLYFDGKQYISSSRAAKISGYVNDYIGQLCRDGKLECRMVGRSWYVSLESLILHKKTNDSASKNRSKKPIPSYLRKSISPETVLQGISYPLFDTYQKAESAPESSNSSTLKQKPIGKTHILKERDNRASLKDEARDSWVLDDSKEAFKSHHGAFEDIFPRIAVTFIVVLVSFVGFMFVLDLNPVAKKAYNNYGVVISTSIQQDRENFSSNLISTIVNKFNYVAHAVYKISNDWGLYAYNKTLTLMTSNESKQMSENLAESDSAIAPSQGIVVVPADEKKDRETVVAQIKKSFSDEVVIEPDADGESGVIKPVFKKVSGDDYLYVLVPLRN